MRNSYIAPTLLILLALSPSVAQSYTEDQKQAAIQNLAMISMAKKWCPDYQIDQETTVSAAMMLVDLTHEPYATKFTEERAAAEKMVGEYGTTAFCAAAFKIYGPAGGLNLMMKK